MQHCYIFHFSSVVYVNGNHIFSYQYVSEISAKFLQSLKLWQLALRFNGHFSGEPGLAGVY